MTAGRATYAAGPAQSQSTNGCGTRVVQPIDEQRVREIVREEITEHLRRSMTEAPNPKFIWERNRSLSNAQE